jgi:hypothetical protein
VKPRASTLQRRSFRSSDVFEPPVLVRELLQWTARLRAHVTPAHRSRLFLLKTARGVTSLSTSTVKFALRPFLKRHGLPPFALASIRPTVLSAFYRVSRDLQQVKAVANHAQLATTIRYVDAPEVQAQHRVQIAILQSAYLSRIEPARPKATGADAVAADNVRAISTGPPPAGTAVSMFGFDCRDEWH